MRERNDFGIDRFRDGASEGCAPFDAVASGDAPLVPAQHAKAGPPSRSRTRMMGRWIALTIMAVAMLAAPASSSARIAVGISVSFGPPALPIYAQPHCPGPGYIWTPGHWAWSPEYGYFWVPGTWVMAPFPGALWTPGYWAYSDGLYFWNEGYWGPVVGYYGGIFYGFGYTGHGYHGGYWKGRNFYYNRSVNNIRTTNITNVYNKTVVNNVNVTHVSYNGGPSGTRAKPTSDELRAEEQRRSGPLSTQTRHIEAAQGESRLRASENKGRPAVAATAKPGDFSGREVVRASAAGAPYSPPERKAARQDRGGDRPAPARIEPSENRNERGGSAPNIDRAPRERPDRGGDRPAPARIEPSDNRSERGGSAPKIDRAPKERQSAPRARQQESRPEKKSQPPERRGGGNDHAPEKPHK